MWKFSPCAFDLRRLHFRCYLAYKLAGEVWSFRGTQITPSRRLARPMATFSKLKASVLERREQAAIEEAASRLRAAGVDNYEPCSEHFAQRELDAGRNSGARLITIGEPDYPSALSKISDAPPLLWTMGHPSVLDRPLVAIVGARNASSLGLRMARALAGKLAEKGHVIVSGLARGIDTAAHAATLDTGTVAVMAGGVDQPVGGDLAPMLGGYLGSLLLGAAILAIGTWISTMTKNQMVAYLVSLLVIGALIAWRFFAGIAAAGGHGLTLLFSYLSLELHFSRLAMGELRLDAVVWYISLISAFLIFATMVVEGRRYR